MSGWLTRVPAVGMCVAALLFAAFLPAQKATPDKLHVIAFYTEQGEQDHIDFAKGAIRFFSAQAAREHFSLEATTNWDELNAETLRDCQLVLWLNDEPHTSAQRSAFESYMEHGGGWIGFHASGYNDAESHWPWFVKFLGGAVFYNNNWPPLPASLQIEDTHSSATSGLPHQYKAPANEWYGWKPNPRDNPDVHVLMTLDPSNYPLGLKDVLLSGDIPVVWTNRRYRMMYINMGHGAHIFDDATQNRFFSQALTSVASGRMNMQKEPSSK